MALQKSFTKRLLDGFKTLTSISSPPPSQYSRTVPPIASKSNIQSHHLTSSVSPLDSGLFRRFLHRTVVSHPGQTNTPDFLSLPIGDSLREKLKGINNVTGDNRRPSPPATSDTLYRISVKEAKKILTASRLEMLKSKLREIPKTSISYSEYIRICVEGCENEDQGAEFAKKLDDSGSVIVLGNVVFLQPDQVAKVMETLICETIAHPNDRRRRELEEMEKKKEKIEEKARAMVWRELYVGLGLMMLQTIGLMRLTFWELSWDVMEPICFFLTSFHVAMAYVFFLRTSTEPTFQGYFRRRFTVKQHKLMRSHNFDVHEYNQLCKACYPTRQ